MLALGLLGIGVISGFLSSVPIGPVDFWIIHTVLTKPKRHGWHVLSFCLGIILVDIVYAMIAFWGYARLAENEDVEYILALIVGTLLLLFGYFDLKKVLGKKNRGLITEEQLSEAPPATSFLRDFSIGVLLGAANPGFILFWAAIPNALSGSDFHLDQGRAYLVLLGIALGDAIWYALLTKLSRRNTTLFSGKVIYGSQVGVAVFFMLFAVSLMIPYLV